MRTVRGEELRASAQRFADIAHALHQSTVDKLVWGAALAESGVLPPAFRHPPGAAQVGGRRARRRVIAGAFNVAGRERLFGRWGLRRTPVPPLHRLLLPLDRGASPAASECSRAAPAASTRSPGFAPAATYSAHHFFHPGFHAALKAPGDRGDPSQEALDRWEAEDRGSQAAARGDPAAASPTILEQVSGGECACTEAATRGQWRHPMLRSKRDCLCVSASLGFVAYALGIALSAASSEISTAAFRQLRFPV